MRLCLAKLAAALPCKACKSLNKVKGWLNNMSAIKRVWAVIAAAIMILCLSIPVMAEPGVMTVDNLNDGTYEIEVESSSSMFKIVKCELIVADKEMKAKMTLSGKGYEKLYMGKGSDAENAPDSDFYYYQVNEDGSYSYTVPIDRLNSAVPCAAFSIKQQKWYDRNLTFRSENLPANAVKKQHDIKKLAWTAGLVVFIGAVCAAAVFAVRKIVKGNRENNKPSAAD